MHFLDMINATNDSYFQLIVVRNLENKSNYLRDCFVNGFGMSPLGYNVPELQH